MNIPYPGTFTAQSKAADTLATVQTPVGGNTVQLTLDHHKYVDFLVEDIARAQASEELMNRYITPAAIALAEDLETNLIAEATATWNVNSSVGTAGTDLAAAPIRAARRILNQEKIPQTDRALAFSPKDEAAILGDSNLQTYFAFAQQQAIREGSIGRLYGFDLYMSQLIASDGTNQSFTITESGTPTGGFFTVTIGGVVSGHIAFNAAPADVLAALEAMPNVGSGNVTVILQSGTAPNSVFLVTFIGDFAGETAGAVSVTDSTTGGTHSVVEAAVGSPATTNLAFHPNALMLGVRPFREIEPNSGAETSIMVDSDSGLAIRVVHQYSLPYRSHYVGFDILYGFVPLRPNHGVLIIS